MDAKTYLKVTAVNLALLGVGALVNPAIVKTMAIIRVVHAQDDKNPPPTKAPAKADAPKPTIPPECLIAECVTPGVGMPSAAIGTLLVGRFASDSAMVNGYDVLKLQDSILNALQRKGILSPAEAQAVANNAKVEKPLRVKPPAQ
jgi:hypothetical protein